MPVSGVGAAGAAAVAVGVIVEGAAPCAGATVAEQTRARSVESSLRASSMKVPRSVGRTSSGVAGDILL